MERDQLEPRRQPKPRLGRQPPRRRRRPCLRSGLGRGELPVAQRRRPDADRVQPLAPGSVRFTRSARAARVCSLGAAVLAAFSRPSITNALCDPLYASIPIITLPTAVTSTRSGPAEQTAAGTSEFRTT